MLDKKGEKFPIKRSVKKGDPHSPNIFTSVLDSDGRLIDLIDYVEIIDSRKSII